MTRPLGGLQLYARNGKGPVKVLICRKAQPHHFSEFSLKYCMLERRLIGERGSAPLSASREGSATLETPFVAEVTFCKSGLSNVSPVGVGDGRLPRVHSEMGVGLEDTKTMEPTQDAVWGGK